MSPSLNKQQHMLQQLFSSIVDGPRGLLVSRDSETRRWRIAEIVSLYSRQELLRQNGIGPAAVAAVEKWLRHNGRRLRAENDPIDVAICRLDIVRAATNPKQSKSFKSSFPQHAHRNLPPNSPASSISATLD